MIFYVIILALVVGITYYHYVQGGFTATISAACALMAMLLAFGYYETVMGLFSAGKMADYSAGMLLIAIYGLSYIILRLCFDGLIPGNIRLPLWVDRGFAVGFGLIAAIFGVGVFAVGAQLLPFGAAIGMHARYDINDRPVVIPRAYLTSARNDADAEVRDQLVKEVFEPSAANSPWIPVDDWALGIVSIASQGAFAGNHSFADTHPDLLTETFANRLGADQAGRRVAVNTATEKQVTVGDKNSIFLIQPGLMQGEDFEIKKIRPGEKPLTLPPASNSRLLAIRVKFDDKAKDSDDYVRLTPSSALLLMDGQTFYPVGAITPAGAIALYRMDDQMLISMKGTHNAVDLVYAIPPAVFDKLATTGQFKPGNAILQIKLFARIDLTGKGFDARWVPSDEIDLLTKSAKAAG